MWPEAGHKSWSYNKYRNDISLTLSLPAPPRASHGTILSPYKVTVSCAMFNTNLVKNTLHAVHKIVVFVLSSCCPRLNICCKSPQIKFIPNDEMSWTDRFDSYELKSFRSSRSVWSCTYVVVEIRVYAGMMMIRMTRPQQNSNH